jgi:enoyl-CoA hydratase/carnithine racemase
MSEAGEIRVDDSAGVRRIVFARPEKKNAFTSAMYAAFAEALAGADEAADVRVVTLEGAGNCFTAGNDLMDFASQPPRDPASAPVFKLLHGLVAFSKPLIAIVDGPAIGIGSTMLLHCDFVFASDRSRFAFPFVNLALVPEAASSVLLSERVGPARAYEWLLGGDAIDPAEAERAGLVTKLLPQAELAAFARAKAELIATKPPEAVRLTKKLIRDPRREATTAAIHREAAVFTERLTSDEAKAQFMAFLSRGRDKK